MQLIMNLFLRGTIFFTALLSISFANAQVKKKSANKTITIKHKITSPKKVAPVTQAPEKKLGTRVKITTDQGDIIVLLYDKTPLHRDNFIKLIKEHFYDSLLFHRVINTFMIQGGDPESKKAPPGQMLGNGDAGYTIPAEFDTTLYHKRGALCAARTDNPEKVSSGCQFYIVQGKSSSDGELDMIEMRNGIKFSPAKRMTYKITGGTPRLDMNYTVFGEVESGMEAVDKIALVPKDKNNRPLKDIRMKMELLSTEGETQKKN